MRIRLGKLETWVLRQGFGKKRGDEIRTRLEQAVQIDPEAWEQVLDAADRHGVRGLISKIQMVEEVLR